VLSQLLAAMAATGIRSIGGMVMSQGMDWLGSTLFGKGGAGAATASGASFTPVDVSALAFPSAMGNAFDAGEVIPFAAGGVVDRPTYFPLAGGKTGMMGEAGPEAVLPLRRGADGRLGVAAAGGGGMNLTVAPTIVVQGGGGQGGAPSPEMIREIEQAINRAAQSAAEQAIAGQMRLGGMLNPTFA
jgi:lambda family phage tail tape measure protein